MQARPLAALGAMQYRVLEQLSGSCGYARCEFEDPVPEGSGLAWVGPVCGVVELRKAGAEYHARGWVEATAVLPCDRCAQPREVPVRAEIEDRVALAQIDEPEAYREEEAEAPFPILNGKLVDLSELVRQVLVLAAPVRSLCRPDCRGLCPQCGANLNEQTCGCGEGEVDPRLAVLKDLL